jgi:hypothetical protein
VLAAGRFGEPVNNDNAYFLKERFGRERKSNCRSAKMDRHYNGVPHTASIGVVRPACCMRSLFDPDHANGKATLKELHRSGPNPARTAVLKAADKLNNGQGLFQTCDTLRRV